MTRPEFLGIIGYLCAGFRTDMPPATVEIYYDLLGGFPASILEAAVKKVLRNRVFPSLPTVAELLCACHCFNTFGRTPIALSDRSGQEQVAAEITQSVGTALATEHKTLCPPRQIPNQRRK